MLKKKKKGRTLLGGRGNRLAHGLDGTKWVIKSLDEKKKKVKL